MPDINESSKILRYRIKTLNRAIREANKKNTAQAAQHDRLLEAYRKLEKNYELLNQDFQVLSTIISRDLLNAIPEAIYYETWKVKRRKKLKSK